MQEQGAVVALLGASTDRLDTFNNNNSKNNSSRNSKTRTKLQFVKLVHPSTQQQHEFLVLPSGGKDGATTTTPNADKPKTATTTTKKDLYEIQSVSRPYGSFMIGSRIVSNGALHVMTRVDPLFFVLNALDDGSNDNVEKTKEGSGTEKPRRRKNKTSWQPLDQLLAAVPEVVQQAVGALQYSNLCDSTHQMDMVFYKLDEGLVLQWLRHKQEKAYRVLESQRLSRKQQKRATVLNDTTTTKGGAFSNTFHQEDEDEDDNVDNKENISATSCSLTAVETREVLQHSVQVVCEYLNENWQRRFLQHMQMSQEDVVEMTHPKKKRSWEGMAGSQEADALMEFTTGVFSKTCKDESPHKKAKPSVQSVGNKQLAKVNKKGMKALTSFFKKK